MILCYSQGGNSRSQSSSTTSLVVARRENNQVQERIWDDLACRCQQNRLLQLRMPRS